MILAHISCVSLREPAWIVRRQKLDLVDRSNSQEAAKTSCVPLSDVKPRQLTRRIDACWQVLSESQNCEDAVQILVALVHKLESDWPASAGKVSSLLQATEGECAVSASDILTGLSNLLPFQGAKLPASAKSIQQHIDALVCQLCGSKDPATGLGYSIGRRRWAKASQPLQPVNPGGRSSQVDQPEVIAAVQQALCEAV